MAGWDATPWLAPIGAAVPSLVLHGKGGELRRESAQALSRGLGPSAALVEVEDGRGMPHIDAAERTLEAVEGHLRAWD